MYRVVLSTFIVLLGFLSPAWAQGKAIALVAGVSNYPDASRLDDPDNRRIPSVFRVRADYGGNILAYQVYYDYLKKNGDKVHLEGVCASACTLALGLDPSNICATNNAVLMVHRSTTEFGTDLLLAAYPAPLKQWLSKRGGLTPDAKTIKAPAIFRFIQRCT